MWTLRGRLLGGLSLGVLGFLASMAYNQAQLIEIGASLDVVDRVYLPLANEAARMVGLLERDRLGAEGAPGRGTVDAALEEARRVVATQGLHPDDEERAALKVAARQVDEVATAVEGWRSAAGTEAQTEARRQVRDEILQLSTLVEGRLAAASEKAAAAQTRAIRVSGALLGFAVALGGVLLWSTGAALRPISALTEQVRRVASGERPQPLPAPSIIEIQTLSGAFDQMVRAVDERDRNLQAVSLYLRRVLDNIGVGVLVVEATDAGERVRMTNPAAATLWGAAAGDPLPPGLGDLAEGRHEDLRVGDRTHEVLVRPFGDGGSLFVGEDVTDRRKDRERLARSERLALVGQMLAQVTHEVRNPLNAISLHAELLGEEEDPVEARALLATIVAEIRRLEHVTERYLDLARRRLPETALEDPDALVRSVLALEEEALRRAGIVTRLEAEGGPPLETDGDTVRRAVLNLLRNATEAGARHIDVRVVHDTSGVEISVRDDGSGMEPAVAEQVFDPFYSTRARGTGLGLAIARQSLEDLGASIRCETSPGEGTTFRIRLPA